MWSVTAKPASDPAVVDEPLIRSILDFAANPEAIRALEHEHEHEHETTGRHEAGSRGPLPSPEGPPPVPEPSTLLLVGTGLIGVALTSRLSKRRARTS